MSRGRRFEYALQPVLLTRQWELDGLLQDLNQINVELQKAEHEIARLSEEMQGVSQAWQAETSQGANLTTDRYALVTRYLAQLAVRRGEREAALKKILQERQTMVTKVTKAKREVEATEQHRDTERLKFEREKISAEFKDADDQWVSIQIRMDSDGK
jgi:flagellar export protein FliJ